MNDVKICAECRFCVRDQLIRNHWQCARSAGGADIITGDLLDPITCVTYRETEILCGKQGRFFEPLPHPEPPLSDADMQALKDYRDAYASLLAENQELKEKLEDLNERSIEKSLGD